MATGSVDQTGTYVFEVLAQYVSQTMAKDLIGWSVADGYDTMLSLWNPSSQAEDLVATFYYGDSGEYKLPIHLAGHASAAIDLARLIATGQPDADGHVIPATVLQGSAMISSASGMKGKIWLAVNGAMFNVATATCGICCYGCFGVESVAIFPNPAYCPINWEIQFCFYAYYTDGTDQDITSQTSASDWGSGNSAVMTMDANQPGVGWATSQIGQANVSAGANLAVANQLCMEYGMTCGTVVYATAAATANVQATPTNFHQVDGYAESNGALHFDYAWGSTSSNLSDLSACTVNEDVCYPGTQNPYVWPQPPWYKTATPNPTVAPSPPVPATDGAASDDHSPGTFGKPYSAATFTAVQYYAYSCTWGVTADMAGPIDIARTVSQNSDGSWKYVVTKSGASASINPLP